jgi:hypothetical protein
MFAQFRSQYPTGSLVSELVQIYNGSYVVRTLIQVGGVTLASGFASATAIEDAEDHARWRALAVLGITPPPSPLNHSTGSGYEAQFVEFDANVNRLSPSQSLPAAFLHNPLSPPEVVVPEYIPDAIPNPVPETIPEEAFETFRDNFSLPQIPPQAPALHRRQAEMGPPKGRGRNRGAAPPNAASAPAPFDLTSLDLSDIIAQTSVELKRLGWSDAQGRAYLQKTYSKRSRQQLTDEELLDFLNYLQAESGPSELAF